jgi:hypothetical protein
MESKMIANNNLEICEQEDGTYVYPVLKEGQDYSWALYMYKNGSHAELYTKRDPKTGAVLGKPIRLPVKWRGCNHALTKTGLCTFLRPVL